MFGANGVVVLDVEGMRTVTTIAVLPDGKIVGALLFGSYIFQLDAQGEIDAAFGGGAPILTFTHGRDVLVSDDGLIYLAGGPSAVFASIERRLPDGQLDLSFGTDGWVNVGTAYSAAVQPDGKILVAGDRLVSWTPFFHYEMTLARFHPDGVWDTSFAGIGFSPFLQGGATESFVDMALRPDGGVVMAANGGGVGGESGYFQLLAVTSSGEVDLSFGALGSVQTRIPGASSAWMGGIALQEDGKIIAVGRAEVGIFDSDMVVVRYNADGSLDSSFGAGGIQILDLEDSETAICVAVQPDGRIVIAGTVGDDVAVVRLNEDGTWDGSFSGDGVLVEDYGGFFDNVWDLALQDDGKILIAGSGNDRPYIARFHSDGTADYSIEGSAGADELTGTANADFLLGLGGNDRIVGGGGNDRIEGGLGLDFARFSGLRQEHSVSIVDAGIVVSDVVTRRDGIDSLKEIERIQFDDGVLAFDTLGNAGQAYRLYKAAFDRTPDIAGLGHQITALDDGLTLSQVASNFIASPEFLRTYGPLDDAQFVRQLYANVLDREPDVEGLAHHVERLGAGASRADVLVGFSESPENQAAVIGVIQSGILYTI